MESAESTARSARVTRRRRIFLLALAMIAVFFSITAIGLVVAGSAEWTSDETQIVVAVNGAHNALLDAVARSINVVFGPTWAVVLTVIAIASAGLLARSWAVAVRMGILIAVPWAATDVVKNIVQRPRPDQAILTHVVIVEPSSFSYPSGHTAFATALGLSIVVVLASRRLRQIALAAAILVALLTAWSRVYLGVHYPTDVLASLVLVPVLVFTLAVVTSPREEP